MASNNVFVGVLRFQQNPRQAQLESGRSPLMAYFPVGAEKAIVVFPHADDAHHFLQPGFYPVSVEFGPEARVLFARLATKDQVVEMIWGAAPYLK